MSKLFLIFSLLLFVKSQHQTVVTHYDLDGNLISEELQSPQEDEEIYNDSMQISSDAEENQNIENFSSNLVDDFSLNSMVPMSESDSLQPLQNTDEQTNFISSQYEIQPTINKQDEEESSIQYQQYQQQENERQEQLQQFLVNNNVDWTTNKPDTSFELLDENQEAQSSVEIETNLQPVVATEDHILDIQQPEQQQIIINEENQISELTQNQQSVNILENNTQNDNVDEVTQQPLQITIESQQSTPVDQNIINQKQEDIKIQNQQEVQEVQQQQSNQQEVQQVQEQQKLQEVEQVQQQTNKLEIQQVQQQINEQEQQQNQQEVQQVQQQLNQQEVQQVQQQQNQQEQVSQQLNQQEQQQQVQQQKNQEQQQNKVYDMPIQEQIFKVEENQNNSDQQVIDNTQEKHEKARLISNIDSDQIQVVKDIHSLSKLSQDMIQSEEDNSIISDEQEKEPLNNQKPSQIEESIKFDEEQSQIENQKVQEQNSNEIKSQNNQSQDSNFEEITQESSQAIENQELHDGIKQASDINQGNCIIIYSECYYQGLGLEVCDSLEQIEKFNHQIKAIYIPKGYGLTIYENKNFNGKSRRYTSSQNCIQTAVSFIQLGIKESILVTQFNLRGQK